MEQGSTDEDEDDAYTKSAGLHQNQHHQVPSSGLMSPTVSLPLLVFIDMFAVSLVIPLLFQYYKNAGVTSANQRELLSSVFSASQIVGGIVLGAMTDAKLLRRKTILFLSFGGSAVAYAMIAYGGFRALVVSRVMVGLVKQTMTVTTSILTQCTTVDNRAKYMGRLASSTTAAWIVGPSVGALLYKYVDHKAPALLACFLFLFDMFLAAIVLRDRDGEEGSSFMEPDENDTSKASSSSSKKKKGTNNNFWSNLKSCFSSKTLGSVIASMLIFSWVNRATSYASMGSYYEDMYGVEPHHRGYIQSYQRVWGFLVQSALIGPLLSWVGGERRAACLASLILAVATFWEMSGSISIFVMALSPAISLATTMMTVSLRSLLTRVAPEESIFSVFAALDVLQNASAVTVPFYRTFLFRILGGGSSTITTTTTTTAAMEGDPDPVSWVFSSGIHWLIATAAMTYFLRPYSPARDITTRQPRSKQSKHV
jgi:hypothetical protein